MPTHVGSISINVDTSQVTKASSAISALGAQAVTAQNLLNRLSTINLGPTSASANTLAQQLNNVSTQANQATTALNNLGNAGGTAGNGAASGLTSAAKASKDLDGTIGGTIQSFQALTISGLAIGAIAGAIGSVASALYDANNRVQGMMLSFRALGSDGGSTLLAYQDAANSVGASFWESGKAIQSWNASTNGTSLEGQRAIEVFNTMSGAVQLFGGGADEVAGSMRALGQMMNKQQVYSEELVSQLGERFPAALKLAAEATGLTVKQLREALKDGKVASDGFINSFVDKVDDEYGPAMARMANTTRGKVNQMKNDYNTLTSAVGIMVDNVLAELSRLPGTEDLIASAKRVILKQSIELNAAYNGTTAPEQAGRTYDDLTQSGFKVTPAMQAEAQRLANERQNATPARTVAQVAGGVAGVVGLNAATGGSGFLMSGAAYTAGAYAGGQAMDGLSGLTTKNAPVTKEDLLMAIGTGITTVSKEQRAIYQNSLNKSADFKGHANDEANKKATDEINHQASVNETARKNRLAEAYTIADPKARNAAVNAIKAENIHKSADMNGKLALTGLGTELGRELAKNFDIRKADQLFKSPKFAQLPQETQDTLKGFAADYLVERNKTIAPSGGKKGGLTTAQKQDKKGDNFDAGIDKMFDSWTKKAEDAEKGPLAAAYKGIEQATEAKEKQLASSLKFNEITKARYDKELAFLHQEAETAKIKAKIVIDAAETEKRIEEEKKKIKDEINKAKANMVAMEKQINTNNRATAKELENILTLRKNIVKTIEDEERAKNPMNSKADLEEIARKQYVESKTNGLRGKVDQARDKENALTADKNPWTMNIAEYKEYQNALGVTEAAEKALAEATEAANDAFSRQVAKSGSWQLAMSGSANAVMQTMDTAKLQADLATSTVQDFGTMLLTATGSRDDWHDREKHAKKYFTSILHNISQLVIQLGVVKPLMASLFGGDDKSGGGGGIGKLFNLAMGAFQAYTAPAEGAANFVGPLNKVQADGGAWTNGIQAYANGGVFGGEHGIYNKPTFFQHAGGMGVLGEQGPEIVAPLKRGKDGKLGIASTGGGASINTNNFNPTIVIQGNADDAAIAKMRAEMAAEFKNYTRQQIAMNNKQSQRPGGIAYNR